MADPGAHEAFAALPLFETAALVGHYRWLEVQLFAITGRWAVGDGPPDARVHLTRRSARHGWHAELWADRLPLLDGVDPEALTRPPSPAAEELFGALAGSDDGPVPLAGGLAGLHLVVGPRLLATYEWHLERTAPVADGPVAAILEIAVADARAAHEEGVRVLNTLLSDPACRSAADREAGALVALADRVAPDGRLVSWPVEETVRSPGRRA